MNSFQLQNGVLVQEDISYADKTAHYECWEILYNYKKEKLL